MEGLFGQQRGAEAESGSEWTLFAQVAPETAMALAHVEDALTYAVPSHLKVREGQRVQVPVRGRRVGGLVLSLTKTPPEDVPLKRIRPIHSVEEGVFLPPDLVELALWMSQYYVCPLGQVVATMLPAAVKKGTGRVTVREVRLAEVEPRGRKPSALQLKIMAHLKSWDDWLDEKALKQVVNASSTAPIRRLIERGVLELRVREEIHSAGRLMPDRKAGGVAPSAWTDDQTGAIAHISEHLDQGFQAHLLHGITGSGKTEVFLRVIERWLASPESEGRGAIILVPEIALTPQTLGRFFNRFKETGIAVLHSGLSAAERHVQWRRIADGEARLVIGARSAVFAPMSRPGLMVVDEEHESSYKQEQAPRYHARDVATRRAQLVGCTIILASATPSLESYVNAGGDGVGRDARTGWHYLRMTARPGAAVLPKVRVVDMAEERRERKTLVLLSRELEHALEQTLARREQALILLNRRGYAGWLACASDLCGWQLHCDHCSVNLVQHKRGDVISGGLVRCHHCGAEQRVPPECPSCMRKLRCLSPGTQRAEEIIEKRFPGARLLRMDADTMKRGEDYQRTLAAFRAGEADILLGTQMIAKGLDFPDVTLVGVLSADTALNIPDFRASERAFQLVTQVAGRAGRAERPGQVVVQTYQPDAPALQAAIRHDYVSFARDEWAARRLLQMPPAQRMARILIRHERRDKAEVMANELASAWHEDLAQIRDVSLQGPSPCLLERLQDQWRFELRLVAAHPSALVRFLNQHSQALIRARHVVDMDPLQMM